MTNRIFRVDFSKARRCQYQTWVSPLVILFCFGSPSVFFQVIGLAVVIVVWRYLAPNRPSIFLVASLLTVFATYLGAALYTLSLEDELLRRYPLESMAERVGTPKFGKSLAEVVEAQQWTRLEDNLCEQMTFLSRSRRLQQLHEETTQNFINSPGFGVMRGPPGALWRGGYEYQFPEERSIPQPDPAVEPMVSTESMDKSYTSTNLPSLREMHFGGLADFVNPRGFGYVKDRGHVAGFRSHRFSTMPKSDPLRIKRLELVGLLTHDKPVVYVSRELPRMKDLKDAPTRSLSDFEAKGLEAFQNGEDLFVRETSQGENMLGAIRSVSQCVKCHGGERGDLLGAFSYTLQRTH